MQKKLKKKENENKKMRNQIQFKQNITEIG